MKEAPAMTREQHLFVVVTILEAALDGLETGLPGCVDWGDRLAHVTTVDPDPMQFSGYERGTLATAATSLAFYASAITKDSILIDDALTLADNFDDACAAFIKNAWKAEGRDFKAAFDQARQTGNVQSRTVYKQFGYPDVTKHAEAFLSRALGV